MSALIHFLKSGSWVPASSADPIPVSLAAGDINVGNVDVLSLPATAAGENYIGRVGLTTAEIAVEITRPATTPTYTARDVISADPAAVITFAGCARVNGGCGYIVKARLFTNSVTAMLGAVIRLHLYHTAPTAIADDSPMALLYANAAKRIGFIDFPALATEGTGSDSSASLWVDMPLKFKCAAASKNLYGLAELTTVGAAPASGQKLYLFLDVEQY
jgi:hypothetical protein